MIDLRKKDTLKIALAKYEAAHHDWFNTSVFDGNYPEVYRKMKKAEENYKKIYKTENPGSIVI